MSRLYLLTTGIDRSLDTLLNNPLSKELITLIRRYLSPIIHQIHLLLGILFIISFIVLLCSIVLRYQKLLKWSIIGCTMTLGSVIVIHVGLIGTLSLMNAPIQLSFLNIFAGISDIGILISVLVLSLGIIFKFISIATKHPDFSRWSRKLFISSVLVLFISSLVISLFSKF